jgi:hypothetical protein
MLTTSIVPWAVPSERHNSTPLAPSSARNIAMPATAVMRVMLELCGPGRMSRSRRVPAGVPSEIHSSVPCCRSEMVNSVPLATVTPSRKLLLSEDQWRGSALTSFNSWAPKAGQANSSAQARLGFRDTSFSLSGPTIFCFGDAAPETRTQSAI